MKMIRPLKCWLMKLLGLPTCEEVEQFAYDYLEGQLEPEQRKEFELHLRGCISCRHFIQSYRRVAEPERLLREIPLDPDFERRIVDFLKKGL